MTITVIHKRDQTGGEHDVPHPQVYVGRPSPLGNPFAIGKDGTRDEVIALYKDWLDVNLHPRSDEDTAKAVKKEVDRLFHMLIAHDDDLTLVCWCKPQACHGDVIKERLELMLAEMYEYFNKQAEMEDEAHNRNIRDGEW